MKGYGIICCFQATEGKNTVGLQGNSIPWPNMLVVKNWFGQCIFGYGLLALLLPVAQKSGKGLFLLPME